MHKLSLLVALGLLACLFVMGTRATIIDNPDDDGESQSGSNPLLKGRPQITDEAKAAMIAKAKQITLEEAALEVQAIKDNNRELAAQSIANAEAKKRK